MNKRTPAVELCCSLLILLYTYTAVSKFFSLKRFRYVLGESPLIHKEAGVIAWLIPIAELLIVLLLFLPKYRITGLRISLILLSLFTAYLIYIILFASHLPCSCGGVISSMSWKQHLVFNVHCIAINIVAIILFKRDMQQKFIT